MQVLSQSRPDEILTTRHETFITDPRHFLRLLCQFLQVECPDQYLTDCVSVVYTSPNKSRHKIDWSPDLIESVARQMRAYPFLDGYSFDE
jgi:hypothetical protein